MLRPVNTNFLISKIGPMSTISALGMISMVATAMFVLVCSDTGGERICISRPYNMRSELMMRGREKDISSLL
jgi:hypothetical protein